MYWVGRVHCGFFMGVTEFLPTQYKHISDCLKVWSISFFKSLIWLVQSHNFSLKHPAFQFSFLTSSYFLTVLWNRYSRNWDTNIWNSRLFQTLSVFLRSVRVKALLSFILHVSTKIIFVFSVFTFSLISLIMLAIYN